MLPISTITPALCTRLRGVVFDIDDTLTRDGRVEDVAYRALWELRAAGLLLIAVTGRPLGFAEWMARLWPIDLAVGENGAGYVRVTDRVIEGFFDTRDARDKQRERIAAVVARAAREIPWARLSDDSWARRCDVAFDIGERVKLDATQITEIVTLIESEGLHASVSSVHAHGSLSECDKAKGVTHACLVELGEDIDADRERFLFVGDSGNDAAAFSYFTLSAGVANIQRHLDRIPTPPRFVSTDDCGRGFSEIARTVLKRRAS